MSKALTYSDYLRVDELLALQTPRSAGPEHDELLFIVIHQVYELWFKQILHELDYLALLLRQGDTPRGAYAAARLHDLEDRGGPGGCAGDDDAAGVRLVPRLSGERQRLPVGAVPRA